MLLLAVIDAGSTHGYAIAGRLREVTNGTFDLPDGTIYPALHRLERSGCLKAAWDQSGPRRIRTYKLTKRGTQVLSQQRDDWRRFELGVRSVLALHGR